MPIEYKDGPKKRGIEYLDDEAPDYSAQNFDAAGNAAIARVYDNAAGIPDLMLRGGELLADNPSAAGPLAPAFGALGLLKRGVHGARRMLPGGDDLPATAPRLIEGNPVRDMLPSGQEVVSGLNSMLTGRDPAKELERTQQIAEQNPIASLMGGLGGDAATLFGLRVPLKGSRTGGILDDPIEKGMQAFSRKLGETAGETGFRRQAMDVLGDERFQHIMRGAGRTVETGAEAALLEMLAGNDPAEAAGIAMAGQALSSSALTIGKGTVELPFRVFGSGQMGTFGKATVGLAIQGALITSMLQFLQSNPDAAAETAYDKLTGGALLAMAVGLPGKRPKDDGLLKNFPLVADAILTVPRTAMINAARYMAEDPVVGDVLTATVESPQAFGQANVEQLNEWLTEGKPEKVREWYDANPKIQELMELPATLRDVPTKRIGNHGRYRSPR